MLSFFEHEWRESALTRFIHETNSQRRQLACVTQLQAGSLRYQHLLSVMNNPG